MIVLDASVLIAYLDADDNHHADAKALLAGATEEELRINPLTLAEVLVVPIRNDCLEQMQTALRDLEVEEMPFPHDTAVRLAHLRASARLKMPGLLRPAYR